MIDTSGSKTKLNMEIMSLPNFDAIKMSVIEITHCWHYPEIYGIFGIITQE